MKTMKRTILILAVGLIANAAFATGNLRVNMSEASADAAVIEATNASIALYEIDLIDNYGDVIFSKTTEAAADYKRMYDFSLLEDGTYYLDVNHGSDRYFKHFEIDKGTVEVVSERKIVEPYVEFKDNMLKMTYLNFNDADMGLYVYDGSKLLYEMKPESRFAVNEGLDLSKLTAGDYSVVFSTDFDSYEYDITIE